MKVQFERCGAANDCPSIHFCDGDPGGDVDTRRPPGYVIVGKTDSPSHAQVHGASVGDGEQAVWVPADVIDALSQPTRGRIAELCAEVDRLNSQLAKYVGWEPTVKDEYDHACAVAERTEAVVKRFEAGPQLAVNAFVADLKHALEMP